MALAYGRFAREFLAERARYRHEIAGPNFFGEFLSVCNPALKLRALAEHHRATATPKDKPTKERLKLKKESEADAKASAASPSGSPRREKQPYRQGKKSRPLESAPFPLALPAPASSLSLEGFSKEEDYGKAATLAFCQGGFFFLRRRSIFREIGLLSLQNPGCQGCPP